MESESNKSSVWSIQSQDGLLDSNKLSLIVDTKRPGNGLKSVEFAGQKFTDSHFLRIEPDPPTPGGGETIIDQYCRGDDLIVVYAQTPARSVRPHYQWRLVEFDGATAIELTLSMQTSLLDSNPRATAIAGMTNAKCCYFDNENWHEIDPEQDGPLADCCGLFLFRPEESLVSYAEIVFPSDFHGASAKSSDSGIQIRYELFPEFLEKGVIRKARVQGVFLPRENDAELAIVAQKALASAAPPLTT